MSDVGALDAAGRPELGILAASQIGRSSTEAAFTNIGAES